MDVRSALADLNALPEMEESHSGYPKVASCWALGILVNAVEAVESSDLDAVADRARIRTLNMISNFDRLMQYPPDTILVSGLGGDDARPGSLKGAEIEAQRATVQLLNAKELPRETVIQETRHLSEERAVTLAEAMPVIARQQGWS